MTDDEVTKAALKLLEDLGYKPPEQWLATIKDHLEDLLASDRGRREPYE